jgi:phytoene dehydrogenase-like protein
MADAIVIGAGPNGLVAANILADEGWDVLVLEGQPDPGGAVRSGELTLPGYVHDRFSSFYPLAVASPPMRRLHLERQGLRWVRAPAVLAHVFDDGRSAVLSMDIDQTAQSVEQWGPGDGTAWREMVTRWEQVGQELIGSLFEPFPPVAPTVRLAARLRRPHALLDLARFALLPVRRMAAEHFTGPGAAMLLAGNTLHTDLTPDSTLGGFFGWLLAMLGQSVGFPVPEGGSGALTAALVSRLESRGGKVRCGNAVEGVVVRDGRAVGIRLADGTHVDAGRAVLADVSAPRLYLTLVGSDLLPGSLLADLKHFELDHGTVKVDWALSGPILWSDPAARRAGTLHLGGDMDHLVEYAADLSCSRVPRRPFCLFGQMTMIDPTRSPAGTETAWAYTHVPQTIKGDPISGITGRWDAAEADAMADRIEELVERRAPGFRSLIARRYVTTPRDLEAADPNLVGGSVNGGTAQLHQQLVFRPSPGRGGPDTPIKRLYLASASAHPGGGVHGACGANAARAALRTWRLRRAIR